MRVPLMDPGALKQRNNYSNHVASLRVKTVPREVKIKQLLNKFLNH